MPRSSSGEVPSLVDMNDIAPGWVHTVPGTPDFEFANALGPNPTQAIGGTFDEAAGRPDWLPNWVPAWDASGRMTEKSQSLLSMMSSQPGMGFELGSNPGQFTRDQLPAYFDAANWGPAPPPGMAGQGQWGPNDPKGKFWSERDAMMQHYNFLGGGRGGGGGGRGGGGVRGGGGGGTQQLPEVLSDRPETRNWRLLGREPHRYMQRGHVISPERFFYDTHRPVDTQEGAGVAGGSLLPYKGFSDANAWSTKGQVGYFGQMEPFWTSWGAGGP